MLSVATPLVQGVLDQDYANFELSAERVCLAVPYWSLAQGIDGAPAGHNYYHLGEVLVERFALGAGVFRGSTSPRWDTHNLLWRERPAMAKKPLAIDLDELLKRLDQAARSLLDNFKQQLIETWNESPQGHGPSRWARLAAAIGSLLVPGRTPVPGGRPDLSRLPFYMGYGAGDADGDLSRLDIRAYEIRVFSVDAQGQRYPELFPVISFTRYEQNNPLPYPIYFHPGEGGLRMGKEEDAALVAMLIGARTAERNLEIRETCIWRWGQSAEVIGENLVKGLLEYQLQALGRLEPGCWQGRADLQRRVAQITDPGHWLAVPARTYDTTRFQMIQRERCGTAVLGLTSDSLPDWLLTATLTDRLTYSALLTELARAQCQSQGRHYLDDIGTLNQFAARRLRRLMREDHPQVLGVADPDDIYLELDKTTALPVPVAGGAGGALGTVETVRMSLTEFALENLGGFRHVRMALSIRRRDLDAPVAQWLTADYVKDLVTRADIGQVYPDLLKNRLLGDGVEARRREALFVAQLRVSLPLQALELKIKGASGFTASGVRYLQALVRPLAAERFVDGMEIVLRPLAFKAKTDWRADAVLAMFLIGPRDMSLGPLILYRPLCLQQPLQQFENCQALLAAIRQSGDLQRGVLTWMNEPARARYARGGFAAPHIQAFLPGDEFAPEPPKPDPATLAEDIVKGDYLPAIFGATVKALVDQADRQSVSNVEQRWADWKEGAWLILLSITQLPFAGILPSVGRLVEVLSWLVVVKIAHDDLRALGSDNQRQQSAAAADLLFNLATLLLHYRVAGQPGPVVPHTLEPQPPGRVLPSPSVVRASDLPRPVLGRWSVPGWPLPDALMRRIRGYRLRTFDKPASALAELGRVAAFGPARGLVHIHADGRGKWCALIQGDLYEVAWEAEGEGIRVVDPVGNAGPWVRHDGEGRWSLDLRLRGGAPKRAPAVVPAGVSQQIGADYAKLYELDAQAKQSEASIHGSMRRWKLASEGETGKRVTYERRTELHDELSALLEKRLENYLQQLALIDKLKDQTRVGAQIPVIALQNAVLDLQALTHAQRTWLLERFAQSHAGFSELPEAQRDVTWLQTEWERDARSTDKMVEWSSMQKDLLARLEKIRDGREEYRKVMATVGLGSIAVEVRVWKIAQLKNRFILTEITSQDVGREMFNATWEQFERLHLSYYSSLDALEESELSTAERISLLESVVEQSSELQQKLEFWSASLESRQRATEQLDELLKTLKTLEQETEEDLRRLLGSDDWELPPLPVARPAVKKTRRKIIRTRQQQVLSGEVRPATSAEGEETVQVTDGYGQVIERFRQNSGDGLWDKVDAAEKLARPAVVRPAVGLEKRVAAARLWLDDESSIIERVMSQVGRSNAPRAQEDILRIRAEMMENQATEIDRVLAIAQTPARNPDRVKNARAVAQQLREASPRLKLAGQRARIAAIKANPPEMSRIDYLLEQGEVTIRKEGERIRLGKKDFLQEYALLDKTAKPLWYAHFHYSTATTADSAFEAAHLKTVEQRKIGGQYQLLEQERAFKKIQTGRGGNARLALQIHRSVIDPASAQKHFLQVR
ncbi:dermonecrotic toxin domain-containing protein [Pseudomonas sp. FEN]|uniref:dermonecrotic toxin domain-containing protein n=1 Tax=Pseudomonas sp. FEN TaxID=2767468 RepID=UPI0017482C91|nr:DUF6543 domain-containing protein [Pseudomonas sp. FEN]